MTHALLIFVKFLHVLCLHYLLGECRYDQDSTDESDGGECKDEKMKESCKNSHIFKMNQICRRYNSVERCYNKNCTFVHRTLPLSMLHVAKHEECRCNKLHVKGLVTEIKDRKLSLHNQRNRRIIP